MAKSKDISGRLGDAGKAAKASAEVDAVARRLQRVSHVPGLIKLLGKLEVPKKVIGPARLALADFTPDALLDFQLVYGFAGVLAKDGSKESADVLARFAERAARQSEGELVVDAEELLARILSAVGHGPHIKKLLATLASRAEQRRDASEAKALLRRISPALARAAKCRVRAWIGEGSPHPWFGMMQKGPQILLAIDPSDKPDWKVELKGEPKGLYGSEGGSYSNWGGVVTQDDFGLPRLAKLVDFPAWVTATEAKLGAKFSIELASIDVARTKSAIPAIRAWLGGK